VVFPLRD